MDNTIPLSTEEINNKVHTIIEDGLQEELIEVGYNEENLANPMNSHVYLIRYLVENELYCDGIDDLSNNTGCKIEGNKFFPMTAYSEVHKKTENFPAGVVIENNQGSHKILAVYPTVMTDMIEEEGFMRLFKQVGFQLTKQR